ncbi:glycosylphosphatidylinositol anchor biosynthesis [Lunasporangiospora selenospora]|uniref:Glycosylphosphatidylinositol anchor biosynthesis n=1 Tax=Lunasporangiospora selenospora TaxID=979761 RepID=A0A9P6G5F8_9FUNG|nr:glycosylphosphatidylinositol anchor biosynthesis [Lunasporangiospora selenospora]
MRLQSLLKSITFGLCAASLSLAILGSATVTTSTSPDDVKTFFSKNKTKSGHTNNWAVLVCTSRFWFNYRHIANTLSMYRTVKRLGIPDSNIIMMLADDVACNPRNTFPATVFNNRDRHLDLYGENVEVDYRGYEVTVENFIRLLTGRVPKETPRSKRLMTDDQSNILVYMTGHGGEEFLKFQDAEEISAYDLGDAFQQMYEKKRYNEILFMIDTCQANTMYTKIHSPNILATGSSKLDQSSYSHHDDPDIGVAVIDRFTYYVLEVLEKVNMQSKTTMKDLFNSYNPSLLNSDPGVRDDLFPRPLDQVLLTDFFGNVQRIELTETKNQSIGDSATSPKDDYVPQEAGYFIPPEEVKREGNVAETDRGQGSLTNHMFEIGANSESSTLSTWRYMTFVVLSGMLLALVAGSSSKIAAKV